ncbi:MAG: biotin/lipoyl-containing protein [Streptosporangiaceae bacterium]
MTTPEAPQTAVPDSVTYREVAELLRTFAASGWTGMTLRTGGMTITTGRHGPPASAPGPAASAAANPATANPAAANPATTPGPATAPAPPVTAAAPNPPVTTAAPPARYAQPDTTGCIPVRSPAVGSFWVAPSPGAPPFTEPGRTVAEGDQLAIVEVMKLMNPVLAPEAGEIVLVCAVNADLVEYDQILFWIRPLEPADG